MTDNLPPSMYGIWIPGKGWWKLPKPGGGDAAYAELRLDVAYHYAARVVGHGAYVQPIDKSLELGEAELLALEKERNDQSLRGRLRRWWKGRHAGK